MVPAPSLPPRSETVNRGGYLGRRSDPSHSFLLTLVDKQQATALPGCISHRNVARSILRALMPVVFPTGLDHPGTAA
jgi:hypothetical protein